MFRLLKSLSVPQEILKPAGACITGDEKRNGSERAVPLPWPAAEYESFGPRVAYFVNLNCALYTAPSVSFTLN